MVVGFKHYVSHHAYADYTGMLIKNANCGAGLGAYIRLDLPYRSEL